MVTSLRSIRRRRGLPGPGSQSPDDRAKARCHDPGFGLKRLAIAAHALSDHFAPSIRRSSSRNRGTLVAGGARAKRTQGHGVAQNVHRRDAVLPAVPHRAMEQIHRSWFDMRGPALPALPQPPTQPQCARREKRHCDDIFIRRSVAVPADSSTRRILRHHELFKRLGRYAADLACNVGERQKVIGNARIGAWLLACEDIPVPEGVYAAIALMAVKFERLQGQLFKSLDEALFVGGRYYIRDIAETGRQLRLPEQVVHAADG